MATKSKPVNRISENGNGKHKDDSVVILQLRKKSFNLPIKGTSPLIVHRFSEKPKRQIEAKQQQKATQGKEKRDPHSEFLASLYVISGNAGEKKARYGIPASGVKNCLVSACRFVSGMQMTVARGAFHVMEDEAGLVEVHYDEMRMREDTVRLSGPGRALDLRYRPEFIGWKINPTIVYNETVISPEQIVNLANTAGFGIGLCEWRPERNGAYGMFEVDIS